jgi:hypothetical protein
MTLPSISTEKGFCEPHGRIVGNPDITPTFEFCRVGGHSPETRTVGVFLFGLVNERIGGSITYRGSGAFDWYNCRAKRRSFDLVNLLADSHRLIRMQHNEVARRSK